MKQYTLITISSILLTFFVFYVALLSVVHTSSLYGHIDSQEVYEKNNMLLKYLFNTPFSDGELDFLTPAEKSHMHDVKRLFDIAFIINVICVMTLAGILAYYVVMRKEDLEPLIAKTFRGCGFAIIGVCIVVSASSLFSFSTFWVTFHRVFFPSGNWVFPASSTLITMYPEHFFYAIMVRFVFYVTTISVIMIGLSFFMDNMRDAEKKFTASGRR